MTLRRRRLTQHGEQRTVTVDQDPDESLFLLDNIYSLLPFTPICALRTWTEQHVQMAAHMFNRTHASAADSLDFMINTNDSLIYRKGW